MAKLVDALCSGRSVRKDVLVRIQSRALKVKAFRIIDFEGLVVSVTLLVGPNLDS